MRIHPRIRGDQPRVTVMVASFSAFTPHARGSTRSCGKAAGIFCIYPTCAGINPGERQVHRKHQHLPRRRGDQPNGYATCNAEKEFTPQARGLTRLPDQSSQCSAIYPACAGINLSDCPICGGRIHLPRVCGDQPREGAAFEQVSQFTPQARGSTQPPDQSSQCPAIYPACAGIIPLGH